MILPVVFSLACSDIATSNQEACNKFMEASAKSSQLWQNGEKAEKYFMNQAKMTSDNYLGKEFTSGVGGAVYSYRVFKYKSITFKFPTFGVCDSASTRVGIDSYSLSLGWRMPW